MITLRRWSGIHENAARYQTRELAADKRKSSRTWGGLVRLVKHAAFILLLQGALLMVGYLA